MHSRSLNRFGGYLREKWASPRRIRFWLLVLVIIYTVLGFFALPWIIQYVAVNTAEEDFDRELRIESVHTNPYTLTLEINGLELDDIDSWRLLSWNRLFVDLAWSSITEGAWVLETIRLDQPVVQEERFASGETRFSRLAANQSDQAGKGEESALPALRIMDLHLEDGTLRFADNLKVVTSADADKPKRVSLAAQDIDLSVKDFALKEGIRFPVRLDGQFKEGGALTFDGTLQLLPNLSLEGNANINELALTQTTPYLRQFVNVRLNSGALSLKGQIKTDSQQPFAYKGSVDINQLNIKTEANDKTLIGWESVQTQLIDLNIEDRQVETDSIKVKGLAGQVIINDDKTTNFGQLVAQAPEEDDTNKSEESAPFTTIIKGIELTDGGIHFADNSLPLPFSTDIHTLHGEVTTLNSKSAEPARVNLEGEVAQFGLAHVKGSLHAWDPTRQTNIHLTFRNLQIPKYSPYTVDFLGRKIAGGTMDLDLDYAIDNQQLDGENKLVLYDLELGEKVESSGAMDLPLGLAIALLENSEGVIDLSLPVSGDVDNPQFDFSEIILEALGNTVKSIVTAPFRFLANLVGADSEDLGKVEFLAGRTDLLAPQRQRIAKLSEALTQRPALVLTLAGPFSRDFDGQAVREGKAVKALQERLNEEARDAEDPSLTSESNWDIVEEMFLVNYPEADLEAVRDRFTEGSDGLLDEGEFDALSYRNHLAEQIIAAQPVTEGDLKAIANARAEAVKGALVDANNDNRIAAARVRILEPEKIDSVEDDRIAMEIGVKTE